MKKAKKFLALLITVAILATMAVSAFAADTHTITIRNNAENHVYDAYQIFSGSLSEVTNDDESKSTFLINIGWGSSIADAEGLLAAILADETLAPVFAALNSDENKALSTADKAAVVAEILGTVSNDSEVLDRFAEIVGEYKNDAHTYLGDAVSTSGAQVDLTDSQKGYEITNLPAGYYLIKDRDNSVTNDGDFYTKYIVRLVESATINVKGDGVEVEKEINDTVDGTYEDYQDASIGSTLYYKWTGDLPDNLSSYDAYFYKFIDTMSKGLKFNRFEQVYIADADGNVIYTIMDVTDEDTANDTLPSGVASAGTADVDGDSDNQVFTLTFDDLFSVYADLNNNHKVVVKYSAVLTADAAIATAIPNEVELEYSNNPNGEGTGTTVPDEAYAFTFKIDVDKYDSETNAKLEGVEFVLYYEVSGADNQITKYYAQVADGKVTGFTTVEADATALITDENGAINIEGLDEGTYYLKETKALNGYNLPEEPIEVEIIPTYTANGNSYDVAVTYKVNDNDQGNSGTVGIQNSTGSTLPSTGGMGTTILYILGALLVLVAVVVLITKKRMAKA